MTYARTHEHTAHVHTYNKHINVCKYVCTVYTRWGMRKVEVNLPLSVNEQKRHR